MSAAVRPAGTMGCVDDAAHDLVGAWLNAVLSPATRDAYARDIGNLLRYVARHDLALLELTEADIVDWRDSDAGSSPATVSRRMAAVCSFYRFAQQSGATPNNPASCASRPRLEGAAGRLDPGEQEAVLHAAGLLGPKTATLVFLLLVDGIRLDAILSADVADVTGTRTLALHLSSGPARLDPRTARHARKHLAGREEGPLLLGESATGSLACGRLTRFGAHYLVKRTGRVAELAEPLSPAVLRRTYRSTQSRG